MVLLAAVSAGAVTVVQAWPEFFGEDPGGPAEDPGAGGFTLEQATPESFAADMAALVASSKRVVLREGQQAPVPAPQEQPHQYVPDAEWT